MRKKEKKSINWILIVIILSFVISAFMSVIAEFILPNTFVVINIFLVLIFIFLGIIFDIIGLAVTTDSESVFHSMATKKVKSAKGAIRLIKNKDKVSSFCNDVIGDICGVISGSCGIVIALKIASIFNINAIFVTVLITAVISSLTIGGKAVGKGIAIKNANRVLNNVAKILSIF